MNTKQLDPNQVHTVKRYIRFFESISQDKWCVDNIHKGRRYCALGHVQVKGKQMGLTTAELFALFRGYRTRPDNINDGVSWPFPGLKPRSAKDRVLAALRFLIT